MSVSMYAHIRRNPRFQELVEKRNWAQAKVSLDVIADLDPENEAASGLRETIAKEAPIAARIPTSARLLARIRERAPTMSSMPASSPWPAKFPASPALAAAVQRPSSRATP